MKETELCDDPLQQFDLWYQEAQRFGDIKPDAMAMATVNQGYPSVRFVLYKGISEGGLLVYTNYYSRKARELSKNSHVALAFYWPKIDKQVRIEGHVEKISTEESEAYFENRPRASQLSTWVSEQSQEIPSRDYLLERYKKYDSQFPDEIRCPAYWGGYRVVPERIEFWVGHDSRLHQRYLYKKNNEGWVVSLLAP